jgi:hypothetical protein
VGNWNLHGTVAIGLIRFRYLGLLKDTGILHERSVVQGTIDTLSVDGDRLRRSPPTRFKYSCPSNLLKYLSFCTLHPEA